MRSLVDSDGTDALNAALRKQGKGFTRGRTMRFALNINLAEWNALLANMDKDALDFEASHWSDRNVLRRLWYRFPQWRVSFHQQTPARLKKTRQMLPAEPILLSQHGV